MTYDDGASTACSVSGTTLTITAGSGTCAVTATKAADANYNAVTSAAAPVTVGQGRPDDHVRGPRRQGL